MILSKKSDTPVSSSKKPQRMFVDQSKMAFSEIPRLTSTNIPKHKSTDFYIYTLRISDIEQCAGFDEAQKLLDNSELEDLQKIVAKKRKREFVYCRYAAKNVLAYHLSVNPELVRFEKKDQYGKPCLHKSLDQSLKFNLSHSEDIFALAVTLRSDVGIDVEVPDERMEQDYRSIAEHHFSQSESRYINDGPVGSGLQRFYRVWTLKESIFKALGYGLNLSLKSVDTCDIGQSSTVIVKKDCEEFSVDVTYFFDELLDIHLSVGCLGRTQSVTWVDDLSTLKLISSI